jgi:hypothetical protein
MRAFRSVSDGAAWLFLSLVLLCAPLVVAASPSTLTLYAWPLDAASPSPLASIVLSHSQTTTNLVASVRSFTPPPLPQADDGLIRIGLLDPSTNAWSGVATSAKSLAADVKKKISLHMDKNGNVYHVGFSASAKAAGEKADVVVEVVSMAAGPEPLLNKPVVLNAEGKVDTPNPEDNKSFLQKYVLHH